MSIYINDASRGKLYELKLQPHIELVEVHETFIAEVSGTCFRLGFSKVVLFRFNSHCFLIIKGRLFDLTTNSIDVSCAVSIFCYSVILKSEGKIVSKYKFYGLWHLGKYLDPTYDNGDYIDADPFHGFFLKTFDKVRQDKYIFTQKSRFKTSPYKRVQ